VISLFRGTVADLGRREQEELDDYTTRVRRTIREVLSEFRSVRVPRDHIFDLFPPLRPREFSIASTSQAHPHEVHLCVAIVDYKTKLKARRRGVGTSFLASLPVGTYPFLFLFFPFRSFPLRLNIKVVFCCCPLRRYAAEDLHHEGPTRASSGFGHARDLHRSGNGRGTRSSRAGSSRAIGREGQHVVLWTPRLGKGRALFARVGRAGGIWPPRVSRRGFAGRTRRHPAGLCARYHEAGREARLAARPRGWCLGVYLWVRVLSPRRRMRTLMLTAG